MEIIRLYSDLHNEKYRRRHRIPYWDPPKTINEDRTILVLAGDIDDNQQYLFEFLSAMCERFKYVLMVPGNHEYYGHDMYDYNEALNEFENNHPKFKYLQNYHFESDDYIFVGTTLWFDVPKDDAHHAIPIISTFLNDFRYIENGGRRLNIDDVIKMNKVAKWYLDHTINLIRAKNLSKKVIAVTHHSPSMALVQPRFRGDPFSYAFHNVGMEDIISKYDYWMYAHTHDATDVMMHGTNILSNARGYINNYNQAEVEDFVESGLVVFDDRVYD